MADDKTTENTKTQKTQNTSSSPKTETKPEEKKPAPADKTETAKPRIHSEEAKPAADETASAKPRIHSGEAKPKLDRTFPEVQPGTVVRVHQEITELNPKGEEKKRIQVFEGTVLARKHGKGVNATITVRKISGGIGVERIFPLHLPTVKKIEVVRKHNVRRAKLGYLRGKHKKMREIKS